MSTLPCKECITKAICINQTNICNILEKCSILRDYIESELKTKTKLDIDELYKHQYGKNLSDYKWVKYDKLISEVLKNVENSYKR